MTTDNEAAAVETFTEYFVRNYPGPNTIICDPKWHAPRIFRAAKAAIAAHTAASAGEAVAEVGPVWSINWIGSAPIAEICRQHPELRIGSKLYTRPPAAVPADALERLVEKWRGYHLNQIAQSIIDELAVLIPKGRQS